MSSTKSGHSMDLSRYEYERIAALLLESSSRLEDDALEARLFEMCSASLNAGDDTELEAALSLLKDTRPPAYEQLLAAAEDCAQSVTDAEGCALLMLIPVMAWSRYKNYTGVVETEVLEELAASVQKHLCGSKSQVVIGNVMFSAENIPESLTNVRSLLNRLRTSTETVADIRSIVTKAPVSDFADTRYLACLVKAKKTEDLFRNPCENLSERARVQMEFCLDAHELLEMTMLGSVFEVQPACAFFTAWRQSEAAMRIWTVKALVDFVNTMGHDAKSVIATVALFVPGGSAAEDAMPEIRVGICPSNDQKRVVAGIAWPVLPEEYEQAESLAHDVLISKGVERIVMHPQSFPLEWCEQCGAPMYANVEGMVVHVDFGDDEKSKEIPPTLN